MNAPASAFDRIAPVYGDLWSNTPVGRLQREAFWRNVLPLFQPGHSVLDLGCGTGDDALEFGRAGLSVMGIDSSAEMVRVARSRGVDAYQLPIERVSSIARRFDGVISDFGAMNCVERLSDLREPLAEKIRPGGWMALCFMGRFCAWETLWYSLKGDFGKAIRRYKGEAAFADGDRVFYPTVEDIASSFRPEFRLIRRIGIGVCIPPSYVKHLSETRLDRLGRIDRAIGELPGFRAMADHQLLLFRRN